MNGLYDQWIALWTWLSRWCAFEILEIDGYRWTTEFALDLWRFCKHPVLCSHYLEYSFSWNCPLILWVRPWKHSLERRSCTLASARILLHSLLLAMLIEWSSQNGGHTVYSRCALCTDLSTFETFWMGFYDYSLLCVWSNSHSLLVLKMASPNACLHQSFYEELCKSFWMDQAQDSSPLFHSDRKDPSTSNNAFSFQAPSMKR